ncbi:MAG TPA: UbiA family prenyltransferase [Planctomycetota bacterium]|nr:UbiA family prenyltransferase [Planctomycetota bacterium]
MQAIGRLLRLSLAPSALADVAAGIVFANQGHWPEGPRPWWLLASSACVYHGAMALNDWHDREHDARTRPTRPIPSGAVSERTAFLLGVGLLALGPGLASKCGMEAACWSAGLALLASTYDLVGRGPFLGPVLLALCRAGNLGLGLFFASGAFSTGTSLRALLVPMALYALFVLRVSQLGRLEDGEDAALSGSRPKSFVLSAALTLVFLALLPAFDPRTHGWGGRIVCIAIAWIAAYGLFRAALSRTRWTRADVERAMGLCLRRLLAFTAALAALAWSPPAHAALFVAGAILFGYLLSARLRVVFPPS